MSTRRARQIFYFLLFLALLHLQGYGSASRIGSQDSTAKNNALLTLAEKTVRAIRDKDTVFISAHIDENGVVVGMDSDRMSAAEFRRQLAKKAGVYCVIFDPGCLPHSNGATTKSLRNLLAGQETTIAAHEIKDEPGFEAVEVKSEASLDPLFTLIYRDTGKAWKLEQIEYF